MTFLPCLLRKLADWLGSLFPRRQEPCRHEWSPAVTTYSPPIEDTMDLFYLRDHERERAMLGVTTILSRCAKCGDVKTTQMLGAKVQPPSQGKLIPLRREERF